VAGFRIDDSELRTLAADLTRAGDVAAPGLRSALNDSSRAIRDAMKADASKSKSFRFANDISVGNIGDLEREIGAEKGGAGSLAHIAYFGGANGGGGTVRDPQKALDDEAGTFESAIGDAAEDIL
jgi:hypothetical protein